MQSKTKFTATFADGTTITRTSAHAYTVAWRATWTNEKGGRQSATGFAANREKAAPMRPGRAFVYRGMSSNKRAEAMRINAEFIKSSGYAVEFVPAVQS